jgi:hypothetical protein
MHLGTVVLAADWFVLATLTVPEPGDTHPVLVATVLSLLTWLSGGLASAGVATCDIRESP